MFLDNLRSVNHAIKIDPDKRKISEVVINNPLKHIRGGAFIRPNYITSIGIYQSDKIMWSPPPPTRLEKPFNTRRIGIYCKLISPFQVVEYL